MCDAESDVKILFVEDNPMNRDIVVRQLGRIGFRNVAVVTNGIEALDWLGNNACEIILTDCRMPLMNGFELAQKVREKEAFTGERHFILALSASSMEADKQRCLEAGMDGHVAKPTQMSDLKQALRQWLPTEQDCK